MIRKSILVKLVFAMSICYASYALSDDASGAVPTLGDAAVNLLEPVLIVTQFMYLIYVVLGTTFVMASVIKFFERRINPLGITIMQIIFLFIAGVFMLALPYLLEHSQEGWVGEFLQFVDE